MKLRQVTRQRQVTQTLDGEEVTYDVPFTEAVPGIPFNLDALLRKALFAAALLMTAGAIVWGTVAIGSMLSLLAPAWAAYLVAGVFDAAWAACLAAEYLNRFDEEKAKLPRNAGIAALAISMGAIVWHGRLEEALVVGIVGAAVSLVAKGVWLIAMETSRVRLDKGFQTLLRQRQQKAGLHLALAQSRRDQAIAEAKTTQLLTALEAKYGSANVTVERADQETITAEPVREQVEPVPANTSLTSANAVPEQPSIAELVREQFANGADNKQAATAVLAAVPTAKAASVAATIRRERRKLDGPYL